MFLLVRPTNLNFGWLREPIERQLSGLINRSVSIEGDIVLITGTMPSLRVEKIFVANPEGWEGGGTLAELDKFETTVGLPELIRKEISIDDIDITGFSLALEVGADGRGNWEALVEPEKTESGTDGDSGAEGKPVAKDDGEGGFDFDFTGLGSLDISDIVVTRKEFGAEPEPVLGIETLSGDTPLAGRTCPEASSHRRV